MDLTEEHMAVVTPHFNALLTHVFRVMGDCKLATGVLATALAATAFRRNQWIAGHGALVGGAVCDCLMAVVNFVIDSDFKWVLLGMAMLWAASLVCFFFEKCARI
jgi:hypothetical protein